MADKLQQIVLAIRDGTIGNTQAGSRLSYLAYEETRNHWHSDYKLSITPGVGEHVKVYSRSPELILAEVETLVEQVQLLEDIFQVLPPHHQRLLWEWVVEKKTYSQIASERGVTKQAIGLQLDKIQNKIKKNYPEFLTRYKEIKRGAN